MKNSAHEPARRGAGPAALIAVIAAVCLLLGYLAGTSQAALRVPGAPAQRTVVLHSSGAALEPTTSSSTGDGTRISGSSSTSDSNPVSSSPAGGGTSSSSGKEAASAQAPGDGADTSGGPGPAPAPGGGGNSSSTSGGAGSGVNATADERLESFNAAARALNASGVSLNASQLFDFNEARLRAFLNSSAFTR